MKFCFDLEVDCRNPCSLYVDPYGIIFGFLNLNSCHYLGSEGWLSLWFRTWLNNRCLTTDEAIFGYYGSYRGSQCFSKHR